MMPARVCRFHSVPEERQVGHLAPCRLVEKSSSQAERMQRKWNKWPQWSSSIIWPDVSANCSMQITQPSERCLKSGNWVLAMGWSGKREANMLALFVGMCCPGGMGYWAFSELKELWRAWICGIK